MARSDMRDFEWDFIEKLLPNKSRGVKADIDSHRKNGRITEDVYKSITSGHMMDAVMALLLEKTTKKNSKNSSIPPSQTGKDETKKPPRKKSDTSKENESKAGSNVGQLRSRKSPLSKIVAIAAPISRILIRPHVKICTTLVTHLQS